MTSFIRLCIRMRHYSNMADTWMRGSIVDRTRSIAEDWGNKHMYRKQGLNRTK